MYLIKTIAIKRKKKKKKKNTIDVYVVNEFITVMVRTCK